MTSQTYSLIENFYQPKFIENPLIIKNYFNNYEIECFKVETTNEEYLICEEYSSKRWSNTKKGDYGKGFANTKDDPYKVERIGLLGEMAVGKIFNLPVDLTYREGGDECDFILAKSITSNSKCRTKKYDEAIVVCENEHGQKMSLKNDIYIFSYLEGENAKYKKAKIVLVGFSTKNFIIDNCQVRPGYREHCKNRTIPYIQTKSIIKLRNLHFKYCD